MEKWINDSCNEWGMLLTAVHPDTQTQTHGNSNPSPRSDTRSTVRVYMMLLSVFQWDEAFIGPKAFHYICMKKCLLFLSKHSIQSEGCCTNMVLETQVLKNISSCVICGHTESLFVLNLFFFLMIIHLYFFSRKILGTKKRFTHHTYCNHNNTPASPS